MEDVKIRRMQNINPTENKSPNRSNTILAIKEINMYAFVTELKSRMHKMVYHSAENIPQD